eukprot:TRINITY_DN296_c0_g2_i2.p2 TRINITY_DN296_c0_g2~~TRINITY_DN296_c0_g2_i2.p2  ORF type:complete len:310 (+),score=98.16 TRINITY_DN296_c0_g2_i2:45-974(+)
MGLSHQVILVLSALNLMVKFAYSIPDSGSPRPTVIWHGMGDTCCFDFSMGAVKKQIEKSVPGTYVYSVEIGGSIAADELHGYIGNANDQVAFVCEKVKNDPNLKNGFNAVGFSQGSQFLRAYVERCNNPPVYNLVTMGGQHMGVADLPNCVSPNRTICDAVETLLSFPAYDPFVQRHSIQAEYFHDPMKESEYLAANILLPDINNERPTKNVTYRQNLISLNHFAMFQFMEDTVVVPRESEWFGYYAPGSNSQLVPMTQTPGYQGDWIGLKTLDTQGKLSLGKCPGNHMQFTLEWFTENVITSFLNNTI